jgi:hypothetical protein
MFVAPRNCTLLFRRPSVPVLGWLPPFPDRLSFRLILRMVLRCSSLPSPSSISISLLFFVFFVLKLQFTRSRAALLLGGYPDDDSDE